jgi:hypothetical protein
MELCLPLQYFITSLIIYGLSNDAVNISGYMALNDTTINE